MTNDAPKEWHELLWDVRRSVRYHMRRQRFHDNCHVLLTAVSVMFGGAVVVLLQYDVSEFWVIAVALGVSLASILDLVVGTSRKARTHNSLARRFIKIEQSMVVVAKPSEDDVRQTVAKILSVEADEPPILRNLDTLCHNELVRAYGYGDTYNLGFFQRRLANFMDLAFDEQSAAP